MRDKLPSDFDANWYAATYPDVALSGLDPREHYRRFGRLLGRKPKGSPPPTSDPVEPAAPEAAVKRPDSSPVPRDAIAPSGPQPFGSEIGKSFPIIDRPENFDPAAVMPQTAPLRRNGTQGGSFSFNTFAKAAGRSGRNCAAIIPALQAYALLLNLRTPSGGDEAGASVSCGARIFQTGATRINNAWFVQPARLRLMLAGGENADSESGGCVVRTYQADPGRPANLRMLGQDVQLPPIGPIFHELELLHPLMPLLLELSDVDGATRGIAMLPFPSLLPGGLHWAELKALQTEPNPMDDFWALSDSLLQETIGGDGWPDRSVTDLSLNGEPSGEDEPLLAPPLQEWLAAIFGLALDSAGTQVGSSRTVTAEPAPEFKSRVTRRLRLVLPPESVPTISVLASRRLHHVANDITGPYLVAEAGTYRPRWSISLPADQDFGRSVPVLRPGVAAAVDASTAIKAAPVPLAITVRSSNQLPSEGDPAQRMSSPDAIGPISVLVYASDGARTKKLIQTIRSIVEDTVEIFVNVADADDEALAALNRGFQDGEWARTPWGDGLRDIAQGARHEKLLTISDRIDLGDGRAVRILRDLLQGNETVGSASCALLAEKVIKKEVVLQPASGGLFPTGVSFVSGPRLSFGEPDALQALPDLTYPVVANTLLLTLWRRRALAELPAVPSTGSAAAEDIRIGMDLMRADYRNWCTTQVTARLSGSYVPRDAIDPVGAGYLPPDGWEEILRRVTVVRELF